MNNNKQIAAAVGILLMFLTALVVTDVARADAAADKVTICHATGSESNPYVVNSPSAAGVYNGHIAHQHSEDIIPPFEYKGETYSQNWDEAGQEIWENGCAVPTETPDPDPTETPDPDPTETPDPDPTETPDPDPTETPDVETSSTQAECLGGALVTTTTDTEGNTTKTTVNGHPACEQEHADGSPFKEEGM
jgi:hypothetical protein